jgi:D-alanyl-D-alanine carboxypeptidase (penicillin-binding protein 5/6)
MANGRSLSTWSRKQRRGRVQTGDERQVAPGRHSPYLSADELRSIGSGRGRRIGLRVVGPLLVVIVLVLAGVQWFRPIPTPVFRSGLSFSVRLPGSLPSLLWPPTGPAALSVVGAGSLGHTGSTQPVPIAGIAKVMTAYVVLRDHPLALGATGPAITVTATTILAAQVEAATQQSVVPVAAGETLTELQALEGLLVAQGNDMATLLTDWDTHNTTAFVTKMNIAAHDLGMVSTRFTDPSGLDAGTVSTPADLIRLGEEAMTIPTFRQVVAMPRVTLPLAGTVSNADTDVGQAGIVGIKTGSDNAAGGCFLFEAEMNVSGKTVSLVGAILGQKGTSHITSALYEAAVMLKGAFASIRTLSLVPPSHAVGRIVAAWGASVPVRAGPTSVVGWPGLSVPVRVDVGVSSTVLRGTRIGVLRARLSGQSVDAVLRASSPLDGPSAIWRLTRQ